MRLGSFDATLDPPARGGSGRTPAPFRPSKGVQQRGTAHEDESSLDRSGGSGALGLASASFAGDAVDWNADGTVSLKLSETYDNTVITVPAADLGALIKEGEQPFAGAEITVSTLASGPKGGISGPSTPSARCGRS